MMASDFIVDVSETNFDYEVIAYSQNTPVVVDFWAPWCQPCKLLTPMLEGLAQGAQGDFASPGSTSTTTPPWRCGTACVRSQR